MAGKFTHNNDAFICAACHKEVPPRSVGCRNHCPYCLSSKHVDIFPGDRSNPCGGLMKAYGYELSPVKGLVLLFQCENCGQKTRNIAAHEDKVAPDDYELILKLRPGVPR